MDTTGQLITKKNDTEKKLDRRNLLTTERMAKFNWITDTDTPEAAELREKMKAILLS
ncbi:hypothetical protein [Brevibacillus centrosporus]|uniref:hypothetical protein n=1 Tax=Brevibacillus centrosporus TaxID=54910 RepID=UPI002E2314D3|nr:hypothetical protein [Brevibacillus centrosporus]